MMKKYLIRLLLLICTSAEGLYAQDKGFYYQSRIGIGQSTFRPGDVSDQSGKVSFNLGIGGVYQFNRIFGLTAEGLFVSKGTRVRGEEAALFPNPSRKYEDAYRLFYIEIPLMAKINIPLSSQMSVKVFGGPSMNFNLLGTYSRDYDQSDNDDIHDRKVNGLNVIEQSLVYGAGIDILSGSSALYSIDVRMSNAISSFGDIYDEQNNVISGYNNYVSIGLAYSF